VLKYGTVFYAPNLWYDYIGMPDAEKVLIIEDDKFLSSLIKGRLEKDSFPALQAFDGEEALQILKKERPALIILDLIMPKVSGFEVLEAISIDPQLNRIPVIILSNLAQDSDIEKAKRLGAVEYFVKIRVSIEDLIKKVESLIKK
jgi:CheY-like chemotaxis protein